MLFLYVDGFSYGDLIQAHRDDHARAADGAADDAGAGAADDADADPAIAADADGAAAAAQGPVVAVPPRTTKPSGDAPGGYVVYRQTVELAAMLGVEQAG